MKNMIKNKTLRTLNLAANDMTEATAPALSEVHTHTWVQFVTFDLSLQMLILNNTLNALILSCNIMGEVCYYNGSPIT